jgi:putative tryptophan/tyrosine transport system substrate-binding protein
MRRREFITLLSGTAVVWPVAAHAQKRERIARIGVLMSAPADDPEGQARFAAFRQSLQKLGWTEDQNVHMDVRWAGGRAPRQACSQLSQEIDHGGVDL